MSKITIALQGSSPANPAAGRLTIFAKAVDKHIYTRDENGLEIDLTSTLGLHAPSHSLSGGDTITLDNLRAASTNAAHALFASGGNAAAFRAIATGDIPDGADATAIHVSGAGQITGITIKALPVAADKLCVDDSDDSDNIKSITIGSITIETLRTGTTNTAHALFASGANAAAFRALQAGDLPVHPIGGAQHSASTLSDFNTKISDVTGGLAPARSILIFGDYSVSTSTTNRYLAPGNRDDGLAHTTETTMQLEIPFAGTVRNLRVRHSGVGIGGATLTYTARKGGVPQALAVGIAASAGGGTDVANSFAVVAGDLLSLQLAKGGNITTSPTHIYATMELQATGT